MKYAPQLIAEIKFKFVHEGLSARVISKGYDGKPSIQTIINWSIIINKDGSNWVSERDEFIQKQYEKLSPQSQAGKILERINILLQKPSKSFTTKDADALAKLQKVMEKLIDKNFQLPVMYSMLSDFVVFLKDNYIELLLPELGLLNAVRHFKNNLKDKYAGKY
jgi:transposase